MPAAVLFVVGFGVAFVVVSVTLVIELVILAQPTPEDYRRAAQDEMRAYMDGEDWPERDKDNA